MGVDAEMMFTMSNVPTEQRLREIQYELMQRAGRSIFWTEGCVDNDRRVQQMFLVPIEGVCEIWDGPSVELQNMVRVKLFCRYWGEEYERGPAIELCTTMLTLLSQPDVTTVWYGGDSSGIAGEQHTRARVHEIIDAYCRLGHDPYRRAFHKEGEGVTPLCTYCRVAMIRSGFGGRFASFYCSGCGETLKLRDEDFTKWANGTLDLDAFPRFNGIAQLENKELF